MEEGEEIGGRREMGEERDRREESDGGGGRMENRNRRVGMFLFLQPEKQQLVPALYLSHSSEFTLYL